MAYPVTGINLAMMESVDMSEFDGKTILITGAGRGIGRQIALNFGGEGANVFINYAHSRVEAEHTASDIEKLGGRAIVCKADIADSRQVNDMIRAAIDAFGCVDVVVNNAGLNRDGPFLELSEEDWDLVFDVNLKGPFLVSQAAARHMMNRDGGVIVNISAFTTIHGRPNAANYCCSKAGLNMLTKCMALELGPKIRVNGLGLGFVDSPLVRDIFSEEQLDDAIHGTPLKRMTTFEETAAFVKLLASESTGFVTGQTIMFDGGRVMQ